MTYSWKESQAEDNTFWLWSDEAQPYNMYGDPPFACCYIRRATRDSDWWNVDEGEYMLIILPEFDTAHVWPRFSDIEQIKQEVLAIYEGG